MYAVIRVRGEVSISPVAKESLRLLNLTRANHMVLVKENAESRGLIEKAKDYVTYGEIENKTLSMLISKRGRFNGGKKVDEESLKARGIKGISEIVNEIEKGRSLEEFGIKKVFRLSPPSKGFERKGIKKTFKEGGALGYRGKEINKLLEKMI